jgi:hypothetical protein
MVNLAKFAAFSALVSCALGCTPAFDDRSSAVIAPRVLAIRSEPAEGAPGAETAYRILVVDEKGAVPSPRATWSYCTQPKPTNELNDVATACFAGESNIVAEFGTGVAPVAKLPINACAQFGPDVPQPASGSGSDASGNKINQTQGRPTDPDSTGGYYQPLILEVSARGVSVPTLGETRVTCALSGGTGEQLVDYKLRTKTNQNPELSSVTLPTLAEAELSADDAATPLTVAPSQALTLRASWPVCPAVPSCGDGICSPGESAQDCPDDCTTPRGCGGAEPFAYLDPQQHALVDRHESMRVSWFTTAGVMGSDHTGRLEAEFAQPFSDNSWTAPAEPGPVFMWVVLRDDRGGVDWRSFKVDVQ